MAAIEIQKGIKISFEELLNGITQLDLSSLEQFSEELNRLIARKKVPNPTERELELIKIIYSTLGKKVQERYNELTQKNLEETISEDEHKELLVLVEEFEEHNVKWLQALVELAQLRAVSLDVIKKQLGVDNPNFSS